MKKTNLKALSLQELQYFFRAEGLPAFRTKQLIHWVYERRVEDLGSISEYAKALREKLAGPAYIGNLVLLKRLTSADGTEKYLWELEDGQSIESVLIPDDDRLTLCISSQAGCALKCAFCLTGTLGFVRNLAAHEIVDQVIAASRLMDPRQITNIVLMGMGEPLMNFDNVVEALRRLTEWVKISPRRITLSTAGVAPRIHELAQKGPAVNLAVSLNATTNEIRDRIMPINKTYPIEQLLAACRAFPLPPRRRITFEYVLLKGVNDTDDDARRLTVLLKGIPAKFNLIPFNPFPGAPFERPDDSRVLAFQQILVDRKLTALIRKSKGQDILAACGQLKAESS